MKPPAPDCTAVNDGVQIGVWAAGLLSLSAPPETLCTFSELWTSLLALSLICPGNPWPRPHLASSGDSHQRQAIVAMPGDLGLGTEEKEREGAPGGPGESRTAKEKGTSEKGGLLCEG